MNKYTKIAFITSSTVLNLGILFESIPSQAVTLVTDQNSFLSSNQIEYTESFDGFGEVIAPGQTVTIDSITYTDTDNPEWRISQGIFVPTPSYQLFSNSVGPNILTFGENNYVNALGFNLIPFVSSFDADGNSYKFQFEFVVEEIDGAISSFLSVPEPSYNNFFGFSSNVGIKKLTVLQPTGQGGETNFAFDDVSRGGVRSSPASVPEPNSAFAILAVSVLGMGISIKKKLTKFFSYSSAAEITQQSRVG
jgi:hypothetical protein